jgi:hypothetical protein
MKKTTLDIGIKPRPCCSALLAVIAVHKSRRLDSYAKHWTLMAVIFLGLSIDEGSSLHEMTMNPLRQLFHTVHFPYAAWFIHAWVVLGLAFVAIFCCRLS